MSRRAIAVLLILVGALGAGPTPARAVEPSRDINTYVLFAYDELVFKGGSPANDTGHIHGGNIGVNFPAASGFALSYATSGQAIMDPGTQAVADSVRCDNPAGIFFDLFANSVNASFNATILGSGPTPFTTPIIAPGNLPVLPFTPGRALTDNASDVTVGGSGGVSSPFTFTPGPYRDVRVNDGSTVNFGDGTFDIRSLSLGANVTVNVTDNTILQIDRDFSNNNGLKFGLGTNALARIFVGALGFPAGTSRVTNFSHGAEVHAQFFAPTGWLDLGGGNTLSGRFWAQRITGDPNNNINGPPPDGEPLDHFQCYETHRPRVNISGVSLVDPFGPSIVSVQQDKRLCAPASKNGEDPTAPTHPAHFTFYKIKQTSPRFRRVRDLVVTNQFGTIELDVVRPVRLLVPTAKSLVATPAPLADPIDHYKCYRVAAGRFNLKGVSVEDQFGAITIDVKRPYDMCLPTEKNGAPVHDPDRSLLCYKVKLSRGTPRNNRPDPIFTTNQFGSDEFTIFGPRDLCVPSTVVTP